MSTDDTQAGETTGSDARYWLTNDGLAWLLILTFVGYIYAPLTPYVDAYPDANAAVIAAYITAFGVAVAWAFGKDAVEAWRGGQE